MSFKADSHLHLLDMITSLQYLDGVLFNMSIIFNTKLLN